jgi:hypothetical protein
MGRQIHCSAQRKIGMNEITEEQMSPQFIIIY